MDDKQKELEKRRARQIDSNRATGVIEYPEGRKQSKEVWEVKEGYVDLPADPAGTPGVRKSIKIGPGHRFHPTEDQVQQARDGRGGILGKARELTGTEMDALTTGGRRAMVNGADFNEMKRAAFEALPMAETTIDIAIAGGLEADDFEGVDPEGAGSRYTRAQVEAMIAARRSDA
jgi:hypothetical protein